MRFSSPRLSFLGNLPGTGCPGSGSRHHGVVDRMLARAIKVSGIGTTVEPTRGDAMERMEGESDVVTSSASSSWFRSGGRGSPRLESVTGDILPDPRQTWRVRVYGAVAGFASALPVYF